MSTSNPRQQTRDSVLIAIAEDMIARTSMSQDGFAERLNFELNQRAQDRCRAKDYPDLRALEKTATHTDYARIYKNWSKRVERWLDGDIEIPAWIEESWVEALEHPWRERALIELAGRYGLLAVRPVGFEGMGAMQVFGALMHGVGDVAGLGTKVFDDLVMDGKDGQWLPKLATSLDAVAANCTTLSRIARSVIDGEQHDA